MTWDEGSSPTLTTVIREGREHKLHVSSNNGLQLKSLELYSTSDTKQSLFMKQTSHSVTFKNNETKALMIVLLWLAMIMDHIILFYFRPC